MNLNSMTGLQSRCSSGVLAFRNTHVKGKASIGLTGSRTVLLPKQKAANTLRKEAFIVRANASDDQAAQLQKFAATPIFKYWIQGAVFLTVLAGVDAAYSGDWSRVGVISKEVEDGLKPLVIALGVFHVGCSVVAGRAAASKNIPVPPAVLKVLAVGFLAMVEVLLAEPRPKSSQ